MGNFVGGKFAQFVINEREQLGSGVPIALLNAAENTCEFAHGFAERCLWFTGLAKELLVTSAQIERRAKTFTTKPRSELNAATSGRYR